jgi:heat shock protein HslJ
MKARPIFIVTFSLAAVLVLSACVSSPTPVEKTLFVAPQTVECPGADSQQCLQIKENPEDEYQPTSASIEGFEFAPGYEYELRVVEESTDSDTESQWRLIEVVSSTPLSSPLNETQWELIRYISAQGQLADILAETQVTLEFADGKLSGSAGCNSFFGDYASDASSLTIGSIGYTEMFCTSPEGVMEQESAYLSALLDAASYTINGKNLTITSSDGETILIFSMLQPVTLADEDWEMVAINNGQGEVVPALAGISVTATFSQDGNLAGSAGCNHYGTTYVISEDRITIPAPAATRMFCSEPQGVMEQESAYLAALASAASYRIQQGVLELYDAEGALVVRFQVYQPAAQPTQPPALAGTSWMWREFQSSAGDVTAPQNPEKYTLTFKENDAVEIQADCNHVEGTYRAEGGSMIIQPGAPGPALCSPGSLSDRFLQLIGDSTTYLITEEGELAISILNDSGILFFTPAK